MINIHLANPTHFSAHRSGWSYVVNNLQRFNDKRGIILDDFVEITFGYNYTKNISNKRIPYKNPWIGFLHHPPQICPWYENQYKNSIDIHNIFSKPEFLDSLKHCKCLFVLSDYLKIYLQNNFDCFKNIPIKTLYHPTSFDGFEWDFAKFKTFYNISGIKLITIGYFLRNLSTIFSVSTNKKLDKFLMPSHLQFGVQNLQKEIAYKKLDIDTKSVKILNWQTNHFYDKMLEQSVVLLDLYDTSCNNAIIESFARNSPLIINRHPAIEEYLGPKYPGFFKRSNEIKDLLIYDNICECNEYLKNRNKNILNIEYFVSHFQLALQDIFSTTNFKKKTKLVCKNSSFNHRYGWPLVLNTIQKVSSSKPLLVCDFVDHTFRKDENPSKILQLDNNKVLCSTGYNFFKKNDTEICYTNNNHYEWNNTTIKWEHKKLSKDESKNLSLEHHSMYLSSKWIGFIHNPVDMPKFFDYNQNAESLLKNDSFLTALKYCVGIFVLSSTLKKDLQELFKEHHIKVPIFSIKHPTVISDNKWDFDMFLETRNFVQLGYWLRKLGSFWKIKTNLNKIWLYGNSFAFEVLDKEGLVTQSEHKNVYIDSVSNLLYDKYMRSSLVYLNYYNVSASNAILDCISYATPLLVNRLPSNVEYLGKKYPLYFDTISQASKFTRDSKRILDAHYYLTDKKLTDQFSFAKFQEELTFKIEKLCKK